MSVKPVRVGIVGCGVIAPTHVESYQRLDGVEVRWACDTDQARARKLADKYGIEQVATDLAAVLDDPGVDLVSICTDHAAHADQVVAAFAAGKHVLCEKALGATNEDLDRMLHAHAANPECLFGGVFQHRFDGVNRSLKRLVEDGAFGTMLTTSTQLRCYREPGYYHDYWHGTWAKEGGSVLINQAIHFVDIAQWIVGGVQSVMAHYGNRDHVDDIETEDLLTASLRYADGSLGTVEVTSASNIDWQYVVAVHGTEGAVELRNGKPVQVAFRDEELARRVGRQLHTANDPCGVDAGKAYYGTGHSAQIADMVDAVRENRPPFVTGQMAGQPVRVVLAAYESHRTGRRVELPAAAAVSA